MILQDGVTIGANSCVDRGAFDDTVIGENTKIDNLVQIAHNVPRRAQLRAWPAHTGISGSVTIGDGVQFGGRAGVADHVTIGDGARIGARGRGDAATFRPARPGAACPARPIRQWMREVGLARAGMAGREGRE